VQIFRRRGHTSAVSRTDIIAAYRLLLGREPKPSEVEVWRGTPTIDEIRERFMASDEFGALVAQGFSAFKFNRPPPIEHPALQIEWQMPPRHEAAMLLRTAEVWNRFGNADPHWSVLSSDQFRSSNFERHADEFWSSGATEAALLYSILERHNVDASVLSTAVEYGCGVGRVTAHLATRLQHLIAIDISDTHLKLAAETIRRAGRSNVELRRASLPNVGMSEPFDLWFTRLVLQHNPPPIMALILRRMFSLLAPGGIAVFQLTTYAPGYSFSVDSYLASVPRGIEMHCLPQAVVFGLAAEVGAIPLEVLEDRAMTYPWLSNLFVFRRPGGSLLSR
jgi:SAM-dependent methyltransferase